MGSHHPLGGSTGLGWNMCLRVNPIYFWKSYFNYRKAKRFNYDSVKLLNLLKDWTKSFQIRVFHLGLALKNWKLGIKSKIFIFSKTLHFNETWSADIYQPTQAVGQGVHSPFLFEYYNLYGFNPQGCDATSSMGTPAAPLVLCWRCLNLIGSVWDAITMAMCGKTVHRVSQTG